MLLMLSDSGRLASICSPAAAPSVLTTPRDLAPLKHYSEKMLSSIGGSSRSDVVSN